MFKDSLDSFDVLSDDILIEEVGGHIQANLQDEIVREALKSGVDLREYSNTIKKELLDLEALSIVDYVESREKVVELHKQIVSSDAILKRMEEILYNFHNDLGSISSDIQSLQKKSLHMHQCLQNRQIVRGELCQFMAEMVVPEQMINHILDTAVTERHFLEQLHELDHKLKFVKEQSFKDSKSAQDVSEILEQLKIKAIIKIREYLLQKIYAFRKPMTNFQVPQDMMLKYRFFNEFLLGNDRTIANEISKEYIETVSKIYYSYFKTYVTKLMKLQFDRNPDKEDLLGKEDFISSRRSNSNTASMFLQSSVSSSSLKNKGTVFSLAQRDSILSPSALEAPIILPHTVIATQKSDSKMGSAIKFTFETLFRSQHYALLDNCCREYLFLCDFFMLSQQAGLEFFQQIMSKTLTIFQKQMDTYTVSCYDSLSLLLCIRIVICYKQLCNDRGVPALDSYWAYLQKLLLPRWYEVMDAHIASLTQHALIRPSGTTHNFVDTRPYSVTRQYAEFCAALHTILRRKIDLPGSNPPTTQPGLSMVNTVSVSGGIKSLNSDAQISSRLMRMQVELEEMLVRLADHLSSTKEKLIFFINNCDLILSVLTECEVADCIEGVKFKDVMGEKITEFVEEVLMPYFGSLIHFIKDTEINHSKNPKNEYTPNEEIKVQRIIKGFNIDWKTSIEKINGEIMTSFTNFCTGTQIFQAVLSQLIQYYRRMQACMNLAPFKNMPIKNELVNIHHIMVEIKKFKPNF